MALTFYASVWTNIDILSWNGKQRPQSLIILESIDNINKNKIQKHNLFETDLSSDVVQSFPHYINIRFIHNVTYIFHFLVNHAFQFLVYSVSYGMNYCLFLNTWDSLCNLIGSCPCLYHAIKKRPGMFPPRTHLAGLIH